MRGIGDRLDLDEVREVYLPLSRLLSIWASSFQRIGSDVSEFLGREQDIRTPFVVGVAGSVSVGKSTIARNLLEDDKGLQNADNVLPVLNAGKAEDKKITEALNKLTKVLTTEDLGELNRRVDSDREKPKDVAADFLKEKELVS